MSIERLTLFLTICYGGGTMAPLKSPKPPKTPTGDNGENMIEEILAKVRHNYL